MKKCFDNLCSSCSQVRSALSEDARKEGIFDTPETMFNFFIERVRSNLHIILCMSPVGDPFRYVSKADSALVPFKTVVCLWLLCL